MKKEKVHKNIKRQKAKGKQMYTCVLLARTYVVPRACERLNCLTTLLVTWKFGQTIADIELVEIMEELKSLLGFASFYVRTLKATK